MSVTHRLSTRSPHRTDVNWQSFASVYDVMAELNPAYRELNDSYRTFLAGLRLRAGDRLVEVGAGTGNYSLTAAEAWPQCHVLHIDASEEMNQRTREKRAERGLGNIEIRTADADTFDLPDESAALVTAVHALYTFADAPAVIARMFRWLRPGGAVWACDPCSPLNVGEWQRYIFKHSCRERGVLRTARLFWRARDAARQNRRIGKALVSGDYWGKDARTFRAAFEDAGFEVSELRSAYRGLSHLIVAQKPMTVARLARVNEPYEAAL